MIRVTLTTFAAFAGTCVAQTPGYVLLGGAAGGPTCIHLRVPSCDRRFGRSRDADAARRLRLSTTVLAYDRLTHYAAAQSSVRIVARRVERTGDPPRPLQRNVTR